MDAGMLDNFEFDSDTDSGSEDNGAVNTAKETGPEKRRVNDLGSMMAKVRT